MNITLSADAQLIEKARQYASRHGTTLNQLFRDYLARVVGEMSAEEAARDYALTARTMSGRSPDGWRFDRNRTHRYEGG